MDIYASSNKNKNDISDNNYSSGMNPNYNIITSSNSSTIRHNIPTTMDKNAIFDNNMMMQQFFMGGNNSSQQNIKSEVLAKLGIMEDDPMSLSPENSGIDQSKLMEYVQQCKKTLETYRNKNISTLSYNELDKLVHMGSSIFEATKTVSKYKGKIANILQRYHKSIGTAQIEMQMCDEKIPQLEDEISNLKAKLFKLKTKKSVLEGLYDEYYQPIFELSSGVTVKCKVNQTTKKAGLILNFDKNNSKPGVVAEYLSSLDALKSAYSNEQLQKIFSSAKSAYTDLLNKQQLNNKDNPNDQSMYADETSSQNTLNKLKAVSNNIAGGNRFKNLMSKNNNPVFEANAEEDQEDFKNDIKTKTDINKDSNILDNINNNQINFEQIKSIESPIALNSDFLSETKKNITFSTTINKEGMNNNEPKNINNNNEKNNSEEEINNNDKVEEEDYEQFNS